MAPSIVPPTIGGAASRYTRRDDAPRLSPTAAAASHPARSSRRYWQKRALLVRGALPAIRWIITRDSLFALAARDDVDVARSCDRTRSR